MSRAIKPLEMNQASAAWQTKTLSEVCEVIAGQSPEGKYYNSLGEGIPFYQGKKEFTEKYLGPPTTWTTRITKEARDGDILMSVRAPVGPVNFSTDRICIGRGLAAIRASGDIDKEFLFNFLIKHENEIVGSTGAVFNSINKLQIENILIPVPPIAEQRKVVKVLNEVFERAIKAKENAEKNLQNAWELFESYLQEAFDKHNCQCPKRRLGDLVSLSRGHNPPKSKFSRTPREGYVRFYQIRDGGTDDYAVYVPDTPQLHKVEKEDILMVAYRHIGRVFRGVSGAFNYNAREKLDQFLGQNKMENAV